MAQSHRERDTCGLHKKICNASQTLMIWLIVIILLWSPFSEVGIILQITLPMSRQWIIGAWRFVPIRHSQQENTVGNLLKSLQLLSKWRHSNGVQSSITNTPPPTVVVVVSTSQLKGIDKRLWYGFRFLHNGQEIESSPTGDSQTRTVLAWLGMRCEAKGEIIVFPACLPSPGVH